MKRHLLWTFDRGSFQWDILCLLILVFLFAIPRYRFHDVPEFMKAPPSGTLSNTKDRNGNSIFTFRLETPFFFDSSATRKMARGLLEKSLGEPVKDNARTEPVRDWTGRVIGYAVWKEK